MSYLEKQAHRNQVADLILQNADGEDLIVSSPLTCLPNGIITFEVSHPGDRGETYRVTLKIDPLEN